MSDSTIPIIMTVRTQSQRCPRKMLRPFYNGKNLTEIAAEKFKGNPNVYIAGNEAVFEEIAERYGISYIHRSDRSVMGETIPEYLEFIKDLNCDAVSLFNVCCPLATAETMEEAIRIYRREGCRTLKPVVQDHEVYLDHNYLPLTEDAAVANSKMRKPLYRICNNLDVFDRKYVLEHGELYDEYLPGDPYFMTIDEEETPDIDTEAQFAWAKSLYEAKYSEK